MKFVKVFFRGKEGAPHQFEANHCIMENEDLVLFDAAGEEISYFPRDAIAGAYEETAVEEER